MIFDILIWGFVIGIIHFFIGGLLYLNPLVARHYEEGKNASAVRVWDNQKEYLLKMFLGTQIEIYILTTVYLYLRQEFASPYTFSTALILAVLSALLRVYPRFWNMWIQSTYPRRLLFIEIINGVIGTFVIILGLWLLPVM